MNVEDIIRNKSDIHWSNFLPLRYTEQSVTQEGMRGFLSWQYILSKCNEKEKEQINNYYYHKFKKSLL